MKHIYRLIRFNRLITNHRVKFAGVLLWDLLGWRNLFVRLDPVNACNLKCAMCYFSDKEYVKKTKGIFDDRDLARLAELFYPQTLQLMVGCGTEPTLHRNFMLAIKLGREYGVPYIGVTTNGQRLTEEHMEGFMEYGLDEVTFSTHGVRKGTYEKLMVNASFDRFCEMLARLHELKQRRGASKPEVRLNYTVNEDNLDELSDFFKVYGDYHMQTLQIRPMADVGNTAYAYRDFGPLIPRYQQIVAELERECHRRGIVFMATTMDPTYRTRNKSSYVLTSVMRYINPQVVWRPDFDWKNETYRQYCKRTGWRKQLLGNIFTGPEKLETADHNLTYEVKI